MPGPKPTPSAIHLIRNGGGGKTLGRRPVPESVECAGPLTEEPPDWMSDSQRAAWNATVKVAPPGLLKDLDRTIFTTWIVAQDLHAHAAVMLELFGMTQTSEKGYETPSPYIGILDKMSSIMIRCCGEMGFTPASRTKVTVEKKQQGNAFSELLGKKEA